MKIQKNKHNKITKQDVRMFGLWCGLIITIMSLYTCSKDVTEPLKDNETISITKQESFVLQDHNKQYFHTGIYEGDTIYLDVDVWLKDSILTVRSTLRCK